MAPLGFPGNASFGWALVIAPSCQGNELSFENQRDLRSSEQLRQARQTQRSKMTPLHFPRKCDECECWMSAGHSAKATADGCAQKSSLERKEVASSAARSWRTLLSLCCSELGRSNAEEAGFSQNLLAFVGQMAAIVVWSHVVKSGQVLERAAGTKRWMDSAADFASDVAAGRCCQVGCHVNQMMTVLKAEMKENGMFARAW